MDYKKIEQRAKEIEQLAKTEKTMPKGLKFSEQCYFLAIKNLILLFRLNELSRDEVVKEKLRLYNEFFKLQREEFINSQIHKIRMALHEVSKQMYTGECKVCKKAIQIFDGFIRVE